MQRVPSRASQPCIVYSRVSPDEQAATLVYGRWRNRAVVTALKEATRSSAPSTMRDLEPIYVATA